MNRIHEKLPLQLLALIVFALPLFSLAPSVDRKVDEEQIKWTRDLKLTWDHFKARPDRMSQMDALTESGITFEWSCDWRGFRVEAYAIFVPGGSWVKEPTNALLLHEQAHFDITEIHARKMRKLFAEMPDPCRLGRTGIDNAAKAIIATNYEVQNEYDRATAHGEDTKVQQEWLSRIAKELQELEPWAE